MSLYQSKRDTKYNLVDSSDIGNLIINSSTVVSEHITMISNRISDSFYIKIRCIKLSYLMKYVVTGGLGFIGGHLAGYLLEHNHDVIVVDNAVNNVSGNIFNAIDDQIKIHRIDIRDLESLKRVLKDVDGIFHQAGLTSVQESFQNESEYYSTNVQGTENIFRMSRELDIKTVFASSAAVYGAQGEMPISEDAETHPLSPYGKQKLECERWLSDPNNRLVGLRYFNVYGKNQSSNHPSVIRIFSDNIHKKEELIINGDGSQIRDFVHVLDVVRANYAAMTSTIDRGLFNIGSGVPISITQLAHLMIKISGRDLDVRHVAIVGGDIKASHADISRAKDILSWYPTVTLEDGLASILIS